MITFKQRQRLMQQMNEDEEIRGWIVLSKCGAGLAILALIAIIGASGGDGREHVASVRQTSHSIPSAEQRRRAEFEGRRAGYEQQTERSRLAGHQRPSEAMLRAVIH